MDEQKIKEVAYSAPWLKIMHYSKKGSKKYTGQLDGQNFFVSPLGKDDPLEELRANILLFRSSAHIERGGEKKHPQCVFPLRYHLIQNHFDVSDKVSSCPDLERFMKKFNLERIYLAFSTAYPNNPASMFGHTFLRLSSTQKNDEGLFDYSISYAAHTPPQEGGIWFAVKGIFGGYHGRFSVLPYYVKLKQYGHMENRDIWEYQLNFTRQEIRFLLLHIWEIEINSYYDYYFFSENCAYHLLTLMEAVRPSLKLTHNIFFLSPPDAIKKVVEARGLVTSVKFRPSYRRILWQQYRRLNSKKKETFHSLLKGNVETQDTESLNAAISYYQYKKHSGDELNKREQQSLDRLLLNRSKLPLESAPPLPIEPALNRPERGHDRTLVALSQGYGAGAFFQEFYWQSAYHDLLANDRGYEPFSEIIYPSLSLRYQNSRLKLEKNPFYSDYVIAPCLCIGNQVFLECGGQCSERTP